MYDAVWGREVLTQPAAIKVATDWVLANGAVGIFDAGDVQANGFQIAEPDRPGQFISEAGASYMGFGVSALLATAVARRPFYGVAFSGDGSFTMNPQILIDGVQHGARGCILLFDNRRMAAISGLQMAQFGRDFATNDSVAVDYVAWAKAVPGVKALHSGYSLETLPRCSGRGVSAPRPVADSYPGLLRGERTGGDGRVRALERGQLVGGHPGAAPPDWTLTLALCNQRSISTIRPLIARPLR